TECDAAKCCALPASDKASCWEDQALECATYRAACMALELDNNSISGGGGGTGGGGMASLPSKTTLESPKPSYLDGVCSHTSLETPSGFDACSEVCRPSRCCHPEMYGCEVVESDKQWCGAYEVPCAGVAESWRGSGHAVAPSSSSTNIGSSNDVGTKTGIVVGQDTVTTNTIIQKCNTANLNPPTECLEACAKGACCYVTSEFLPIERLFDEHYGKKDSPMNSLRTCAATNVGFCQQYGACEHLNHLKDTSGWHSDEVHFEVDIESVCKPTYIAQFGALECSNVCQPAHCCFSGEYNCNDVNLGHLDCKDYKECGVLYPNYKSVSELFEMATHIDEVCSEELIGTSVGRWNCQELCKERLCCFGDGEYGCAEDPSQHCLAYAGCETLVNTSPVYFGKGKPTNPKDVVTPVEDRGG
ncbi:hypothetical protein ACHAXR_001769, partial [Thalassiosira sp. AJA248-18]